MLLSIITPAFNEAQNLPLLYANLADSLNQLGIAWEWYIIDDASTDTTFTTASQLASQDEHIYVIQLVKNAGSHVAIMCGLEQCQGDCVAVMAADMQDPPQVIHSLFSRWQAGTAIVWAVRRTREGEAENTLFFANLYYAIMRHFVGLTHMPPTGSDFFLIDRRVIQVLRHYQSPNISLLALLSSLGFSQDYVLYDKKPRLYGKSGWGLAKKIKLVVDSITAFSYRPLRLMTYLGLLITSAGFLYATIVIVNAIFGQPTTGWSSLMVVTLTLGGTQLLMMGVMGEYIWRILDEVRKPPLYLINQIVHKALPADPIEIG
jgi:dolichol-phosphate mannosyltransferase